LKPSFDATADRTFVGDFLNPLAVAPLRYAFGIHGAFVVVGCLCAAGALFVALRRARAVQD
jgi:hypothetical protein